MSSNRSLGREKAKENTFIELGTRPEEYEPVYHKIFKQTGNCQLCGQHIGYDFLLKHKTNESKNLYVGADCIVTFCRTNLPNMVASMIQKMEMEMDKLVEEEKARVFNELNPTFSTDLSKLRKTTQEILLKYKANYEFSNGKKRLPIFETISEASTDFSRKKYTTKPKVESIYSAIQELDSGDFEQKVKEWADSQLEKKTIKDDSEVKKANEEFYHTVYFKYAGYLGWDKSPNHESKALSSLEKEIFLTAVEDYLAARLRNKKKLKKNKAQVVEKIRSKLTDLINVQQVETSKYPFNQSYNDEEKEVVSTHSTYVDSSKLYYGYALKEIVLEYGLKSLSQIVGIKSEELIELGKAENYSQLKYRPNIILFKTEEDANSFTNNLYNFVEVKISEINDYLESEDLANDKFN